MEKTIAFFDFDGTITTKDTFIEFIKYSKGTFSFYSGFTILSPVLILFKLGFIKNYKAKETTLKYFFSGTSEEQFNNTCQSFYKERLSALIRPQALAEIAKHQAAGTAVYVVSASAENWLVDWCKTLDVKLIGTKLEVLEGQITGKLQGANCYGPEKVNRIAQEINLSLYDTIFAYGDSRGDKELLSIAKYSYYKPFR